LMGTELEICHSVISHVEIMKTKDATVFQPKMEMMQGDD